MTEDLLKTSLAAASVAELERMAQAGLRILECYRVLQKSQSNIVAELLREAEFHQWEHFPDEDVIDPHSHSQYFYHAHAPEDRSGDWSHEHGHFHTFLRRAGMPGDVAPAPVPDYAPPERESDANCHLIAISMNATGYPERLFTVNRWVTGDTWYGAEDVIRLLDRFEIDQAWPSWPVNIWITEMMRLFRPQIEWLLRERDAAVARWAATHPGDNPYTAEEIEILSWTGIAVDQQTLAVDAALKAQGEAGFIE